MSENLVSDFINNKNDINEPAPKKIKKAASSEQAHEDPDESLKFFKNFKPRAPKSKIVEPSSSSSSSNIATSFLNESTKKKSPKRKTKASTSKSTKRKPKSQPDIRKVLSKQEQLFNHIVKENCLEEGIDPEEMQLALAISESLKDQTNQQEPEASTSSPNFENPFSSMGKVQPISAVLERFGFKCKKNYSEYEIDLITNNKFSKRSKFQKFPTVLTRTSNEKRSELIKAKVEKVLDQNQSQDLNTFDDDSSHQYQVFSFHLQELLEPLQTIFMIGSESRPTEEVLLNYYVTELFDPSFVKADHLLKDWSKIPGRDSTPERDVPTDVIEEEDLADENCEDVFEPETETEPELETKLDPDEESREEPENNSRMSCMDIFADIDDESRENNVVAESSFKNNSGGLACHLDSLHEKFSQSLVELEVDEGMNKSSDSDETMENAEFSAKELKNEVEKVDLTQLESSVESNYTIPYDDSYYSLQQHLKKLTEAEENPSSAKNGESDVNQQVLPIQIDLVSSDDEVNASIQPHKSSDIFSNDEILDGYEEVQLSQNSIDEDELIEISDEEINYSIRKYHNNNESPNASSQSPVKEEETVDLTQQEVKSVGTQLEVVNNAEQSLIDVMDEQEEFCIDDTISNLLEASMSSPNLNVSKRDRSTKFNDEDGLSESIKDIMRRYGGTSNEKENSRSLKKMQSDSMLVKESSKRRKTVLFSIDEEEAVVDLTQHIEDDESIKENSFQLSNFDRSIHQSLDNIVAYSPIAPQKQTQCIEKPKAKSRAKKSLGVQLDDDYIVDMESVIPEPDYKNMTPVELKQALFKYGIRSLPVKKAVKLLEFIYDQLHPTIRVAADEEIDVNDSRRDMNFTDIITNINVQQDDEFVFQLGLVDDEENVLPKVRKSKVKEKI